MQTLSKTNTFSGAKLAVRFLWMSSFAALTALSAQVIIPLPFTPVPITLQTAAVLASGVVLGRDGIGSMLLYLALGVIGVPFFAGETGGFQILLGSTGGYLLGFVAASALAAHYVRRSFEKDGFALRMGKLLLVSLAIFIPGVTQLALVGEMSIQQALLLGFVPFILGDVVKCALVAALPSKALR